MKLCCPKVRGHGSLLIFKALGRLPKVVSLDVVFFMEMHLLLSHLKRVRLQFGMHSCSRVDHVDGANNNSKYYKSTDHTHNKFH